MVAKQRLIAEQHRRLVEAVLLLELLVEGRVLRPRRVPLALELLGLGLGVPFGGGRGGDGEEHAQRHGGRQRGGDQDRGDQRRDRLHGPLLVDLSEGIRL